MKYHDVQVEKIITEAKVEGARNQARIDADVMSNALNTERSRWRGRFSVIESNVRTDWIILFVLIYFLAMFAIQ